MTISTKPYAEKKYLDIDGYRMAYIDEGEGDAIVFQHGNPTSSYLWRNIMPHCEGLGRLIACDLIGMGDSDKLSPSGPDRYGYIEQRDFLFRLWDKLKLGDRVIFVIHDWGSVLGFDWANQHRERVQGICYMESIVQPVKIDPTTKHATSASGIRTEQGEIMMLENNAFVEQRMPMSIIRTLSEPEMDEYRRPFRNPGEDRRPTLSWPRQVPLASQPNEVTPIVEDYGNWLSASDTPKLLVKAEPGVLIKGPAYDFCRSWPNQREVEVAGLHFIQEDSPDAIGKALADFVRELRRLHHDFG
ncbi:MAG: haloalkane dehalogenase [Novosphingobium sp.]|nr:haloalkane dehalogenase [Novosphingobium sp.]